MSAYGRMYTSPLLSSDMEPKPNRRRFVKLALAGASAAFVSGCLDGDGAEGDDGNGDGEAPDTAETAEFGYENWVPTGSYANLGYADVARIRESATLERDGETAAVAGEAGPDFADVDGYISTDGEDGFTALGGSFDADTLVDEISDELVAVEETEHEGFAVLRGNEPADAHDDEVEVSTRDAETPTQTDTETGEREVVVSDTFVVASSRGTATQVVDAALGEADREADESELVQGIEDYVDSPIGVLFNYDGTKNAAYTFIQERDDGVLEFVEVAVYPDEEFAEEAYEGYPGRDMDDVRLELDGRFLLIATEEDPAGVESLLFDSILP